MKIAACYVLNFEAKTCFRGKPFRCENKYQLKVIFSFLKNAFSLMFARVLPLSWRRFRYDRKLRHERVKYNFGTFCQNLEIYLWIRSSLVKFQAFYKVLKGYKHIKENVFYKKICYAKVSSALFVICTAVRINEKYLETGLFLVKFIHWYFSSNLNISWWHLPHRNWK